ncbi:Inosine/uridine-preferring nucleoside hydrolase domain-containing protein [Russula vinacea]|nr:Inosine/uridine-preferring nucleoside hydrolase domain-containing protein [Russula vinacea]
MTYIWLDCDPGHDDATAILLALYCTNIRLLGISTTHGNTTVENTTTNAARCLHAFAAPEHIKVHPGAAAPLLRPARADAEIHGPGGLGGVEGLPSADLDPAIAAAIGQTWKAGAGAKVTVVASGPLTNIALFVSVYPHLLDALERIVFMGGGIGVGNRTAVAEYNILCDPEAAQVVLNTPVPKTMIPLNVTHKAIVTSSVHAKLMNSTAHEASSGAPSSQLRHTLSTLISFFKEAYESTFGFMDGPPLHDALTIAYVDVELTGAHTSGQTVADVWGYLKADDTWGRTGKNCEVATDLDVAAFFELFLDCVSRCDEVSPLNIRSAN